MTMRYGWMLAVAYAAGIGAASAQSLPCKSNCLTIGPPGAPRGWIVGEIRTVAFGDRSKSVMDELAAKGWVECAGQTVSRGEFPKLWQVLGDSWGSADGATSFYLPDLRGMFLRGWNHGRPSPEEIGQGAFDGRDPYARDRLAPRAEIPSPGVKGQTGDGVGSVQSDAVGRHDHDLYRHTRTLQRAHGPSEQFMADPQRVPAGPDVNETRPRNVYVMFLIYVGRDARVEPPSPSEKTGRIVPLN